MKNVFMIASCLIITSMCFSSPTKNIADWDKPLLRQFKFTDPTLIYADPWVHNPDGFCISYALSSFPERAMRITMWVRTYLRISFPNNWGWAWVEYNVNIPANEGNGGRVNIYANPNWQYVGSYNFNGDLIIDDDQYYVSYYGPL